MERRTELRNRTPMERGRAPQRRVALRAKKRRRTVRRPTTSAERTLYASVHRRSGDRCEVVMVGEARCPRRRMRGIHHLVKRSHGGAAIAEALDGTAYACDLCAFHHDLADNASVTQRSTSLDGEVRVGRLAIEPGTFRGRMVTSGTRSLVGVPA